MNVAPPEVPTPGMAGGANANALRLRQVGQALVESRMMTAAVRPSLSRSSQGVRVTKKKPLYVVLTPLSRL